ncbi:MAG TPA: hypothetical protein VF510_05345 [Ktedonobacterales bacterium]
MRVFRWLEAAAAVAAAVITAWQIIIFVTSSAPVSCSSSSNNPQTTCYGLFEGPSLVVLFFLCMEVLVLLGAIVSALIHSRTGSRPLRRALWGTAVFGAIYIYLWSLVFVLLPAVPLALLAAIFSLGVPPASPAHSPDGSTDASSTPPSNFADAT